MSSSKNDFLSEKFKDYSIEFFVNNKFKNGYQIIHDEFSIEFMELIDKNLSDDEFCDFLIVCGFIPDYYSNDSSEETLYSKLVEATVAIWAKRLGFESELIKEKSSREDIKIEINNKIVVSDAKSFRLGRSQKAPNTKDFIKLADYEKWMRRYPNSLGGLIAYPCKHEWSNSSDVYLYCSNKSTPVVMLPYKYLSLFLKFKDSFNPSHLEFLWDYEKIFKNQLLKKMEGGNKKAYWSAINEQILDISNISKDDFLTFMKEADIKINTYIKGIIKDLKQTKENITNSIRYEIEQEDIDKIREKYTEYKIHQETELFDILIKRITDFRL